MSFKLKLIAIKPYSTIHNAIVAKRKFQNISK